MATIQTEPTIKPNSAKKANNSVNNIMNMITGSMSDPVTRSNAQMITTLVGLML